MDISPIWYKLAANVADSDLIILIFDNGSKETRGEFVRPWLKLEYISWWSGLTAKNPLPPKFWYESERSQIAIVHFPLYFVEIVSLFKFYDILLKMRNIPRVGLYPFVFLTFLARVDKLHDARIVLWISPYMHLDYSTFIYILQNCFVRKKYWIWYYFPLFKSVTLRNYPSFYFSFFIRILLFICFFPIFSNCFKSFLWLFAFFLLILPFLYLFNCD